MRNPSVRASDADREEVAAALREGLSEGRLTMEEFDERLEATYTARTYGDLEPILKDLPPRQSSGPVSFPGSKAHHIAQREARRAAKIRRRWSRFASVNAVVWAVWALTFVAQGHHQGGVDLWPLWLTVPWAALLLARRPFALGCPGRDEAPRY